MRTTLTLLTALLLVFGTTAVAGPGGGKCNHQCAAGMHQGPGHAQGAGERGGRPGVQHLLRVADEIKLTEAQVEQLEEMLVEFRTERVDKEAALEKAKINMRAMAMDDDAAEGDVMKAIEDVSAAQAELMKMRYQHHKTAFGLLNTAQQDALKELRRERMANRGPRGDGSGPHGRRGGGPGPGR